MVAVLTDGRDFAVGLSHKLFQLFFKKLIGSLGSSWCSLLKTGIVALVDGSIVSPAVVGVSETVV